LSRGAREKLHVAVRDGRPPEKGLEMTAENRPPRVKDSLLQQAEDDVSRLQDVLRTTKAELARSRDLADRLEKHDRAKKPSH
jgi:hypothetical protein